MEAENEQIRSALLLGQTLDNFDPEILHFVESDLVEDYLEGTLSQIDSERFRSNYLVTDERRELVNDVRLLKRVSGDAHVFDPTAIDASAANHTSSSRVGSAILVTIILAIVIFLVWRFFLS